MLHLRVCAPWWIAVSSNPKLPIALIGAALFACLLAADASAQNNQNIVNVFVPADRTLRQHLVRASKAIDEERFSDAVAELGFLLSSPPPGAVAAQFEEPQDFFLDATTQTGSRTSLKTEAQRLLGTLPPQGRELYELQFGAAARTLLDDAIRETSLEKLHEVTRRYFHTKAGGEATLLLGRLYFDSGRPLAAALFLKQLADLPAIASQFEPELSVLLAACWFQAHHSEKAEETMRALRQKYPRAKLQIGAAETESLPADDRILAWLEQHFGAAQGQPEQRAQWALFRGNESRNAASLGGMPLENYRWRVPVATDPQDQQLIEEIQESYSEQGVPMLPGLQPLAVKNVILMRTPELIMAIDFETGKRVWNYPWWDTPQVDEPIEAAATTPATDRERRKQFLLQRLWQNHPYGQVSSDGELVFLLSETQDISMFSPRPLRIMAPQIRGFGNFETQGHHNQLVALELKREGALKWKVGGETGLEEPQLAGAYFLGPPLPLFGNLYVLAEIRGEVRLVVLDAATGKQQWSQQLAHLEPLMGDMSIRRLAGAVPSFANGVLVCPTSCGAVVGVDIAMRRLLWGFQYPQHVSANNFGLPYPNQFQPAFSRWTDSTVTIADGTVLLTPPESDLLISLDLLTGQPRWKPRPRQLELADMLYIACVHDGKIIVVGKDRIIALNVKDAQTAWNQPVMLDHTKSEMPSGRGFLSGSSYYLPTTAGQLVQIDLNAGQIASRTATNGVLGNLICFKDDVFSLGPNRASSSYQIEPLRKRVDERLAKSPDDAWALARQGELLVHDGKPAEALAALERAHKLQPNDEGVKSLLVGTYMSALKKDFVRHRELAAQIEPLIDNESQKIDYFLMMGEGSQQAGDFVAAADAFGKLAHLAYNSFTSDLADPFPIVNAGPAWNVRLDRHVRARLAELYKLEDSAVRERIDNIVRQIGETADKGALPELTRFLHLCGFHPTTDTQRMRRAAMLIDAGKLLEAEWDLAAVTAEEQAGRVLALRAKLFSHTNDSRLVSSIYEQLRTKWADQDVLDGKTGKQVYEDAVTKGVVRTATAPEGWPWGKVVIDESRDQFNRHGFRRIYSIPVVQKNDPSRDGMRLVFDTGANLVYIRNRSGEVLGRLSQVDTSFGHQYALSRAEADGHLLFINLAGQLLALPLLNSGPNDGDSVLWREYLLPMPAETSSTAARQVSHSVNIPFDTQTKTAVSFEDSSNRPLAVTGPMNRVGVVYQKIRTLTSVDPLTGKTIWTRQDVDQGLELFGDERHIFGVSRGSQEAIVIDATDGRMIGTRTVPPAEQRWTIFGRNILAWEKLDDQYRLFLRDVEAERDIWSETIPAASRGSLVDDDAVAILQPDGRFFLRPLNGDQVLIESKLPIEETVESVRVRLSRDECLVIVNDKHPIPNEIQQLSSSSNSIFSIVNGRVFAFSRADGSQLWQTPAVIRGYNMPLEQPDDLPTLWFVRQYRQVQPGQAQSQRTDVLCIDRRTGAVLLDRRNIATQLTSLEITADTLKREVSLILPQIGYTIKFTDQPRPPEPPAQFGHFSSGFGGTLGRVLSSITGGILTVP